MLHFLRFDSHVFLSINSYVFQIRHATRIPCVAFSAPRIRYRYRLPLHSSKSPYQRLYSVEGDFSLTKNYCRPLIVWDVAKWEKREKIKKRSLDVENFQCQIRLDGRFESDSISHCAPWKSSCVVLTLEGREWKYVSDWRGCRFGFLKNYC